MVHGACSLEQEQELELEQLPYGNRCCIFVEKQPIWRAPKPKIDMAEWQKFNMKTRAGETDSAHEKNTSEKGKYNENRRARAK